jgi:hypothetical protein
MDRLAQSRWRVTMKALLTVFVLVEVGVGLILGIYPSLMTRLLFTTQLDTTTAVITGRVAGIALLSLLIACWVARNDVQSLVARGIVAGMLLYNAGVVALLLAAGMAPDLTGVLLWPAIVVHAAQTVWCVICLLFRGARVAA